MTSENPGIARKERTIARLKEAGIPTLDWLPYIADGEIKLRGAREVAERAVALCACAVQAEMLHAGQSEPFAWRLLEETGIVSALSPDERQFFDDPKPNETMVIQFAWRYEACAVLLWSLGALTELPYPTVICNVPLVARTARDLATPEQLNAVTLRSEGEIIDQLDLTYRLHWAVRDAQINGRPTPGNLDPGVVMERHFALNWLTDAENTPWDDTDTST
ncbi:MAG: DUF4272 domain-containing protein [Fibrella sp.]|nr:DUF4272 domain-containing protein [Armatimonadota bacterium]